MTNKALRKLQRKLSDVRSKKLHSFDDLAPIIERCLRDFAPMFPAARTNRDGSRFVFDCGISGLGAVSLEKPHGSREYVPRHYARLAMNNIEAILAYVEAKLPEEEDETGDDDPLLTD